MKTRLHLALVLGVFALAGCGVTTSPELVASPAASATPQVTGSPPSQPPAATAPATEPSPVAPSPAPSPAVATAFTTPVPPGVDALWTAIHWRKLAPTDPLTLVRSVLRWRGGFIAVGWGTSSTPVWTSTDGAHWEPLPFNTATTFWPGLLIVGMAEVHGGLGALTLLAGTWDCASACPTYSPSLPLMTWTSPDGRTWTPNTGPDIGAPAQWQGPPLLAFGPAGLVAVSPMPPTHVAASLDGIHWRTLPAAVLPAGLWIKDMVGTATGFTAVGALPVDTDHDRAVALQSVDGATWTGPIPLDIATASSFALASTGPSWGATALVSARGGLIAVGQVFATPGATLWWQSTNGHDWRPLPSYPPLGPTTCTGEGCGSGPNGTLVGDGHRMIALRGGADAGVWTSTDGLTWSRLPVTGDIPAEEATQAVLLPGGVLLTDGTTTWFGEAQGH
jgi:hypothetical protein